MATARRDAGGIAASRRSVVSSGSGGDAEAKAATGMVLPFDPLALSFHDLCYYVPIPSVRLLWICAADIVMSIVRWPSRNQVHGSHRLLPHLNSHEVGCRSSRRRSS